MQYKTFILKLKLGKATEIYKWCELQFGREHLDWTYVYGGGANYSSTGEIDQTFIIKGIDNIVLFDLTWSDLKSDYKLR
jgi:hypothetical protein